MPGGSSKSFMATSFAGQQRRNRNHPSARAWRLAPLFKAAQLNIASLPKLYYVILYYIILYFVILSYAILQQSSPRARWNARHSLQLLGVFVGPGVQDDS